MVYIALQLCSNHAYISLKIDCWSAWNLLRPQTQKAKDDKVYETFLVFINCHHFDY